MLYRDMNDAAIKEAAGKIVQTSESEDEVRRRLKDELGYPYGIAITSHLPTDKVGYEAQAIVKGLGGLVMKNGAMVMVMMHGHTGNINV